MADLSVTVSDSSQTFENLIFTRFDSHYNLAYSTVAVAPNPATSGTQLTLATGAGVNFPPGTYNATVWAANSAPINSNAEIVRITGKSGDILQIQRTQEGSSVRSIQVSDQIAASITVKTLSDLEGLGTLGYNEITSAASTSSASDTEVTGIATSVNIPAGGKDVEITVDGGFGYAVAAVNATFKFWDGAVGGTLLRVYYCAFQGTVGVLTDLSLRVYLKAPSAGAHVYRFSMTTDGTHTLQLYADGSGAKGSMTVKLV